MKKLLLLFTAAMLISFSGFSQSYELTLNDEGTPTEEGISIMRKKPNASFYHVKDGVQYRVVMLKCNESGCGITGTGFCGVMVYGPRINHIVEFGCKDKTKE